jgi:hypothetical protein
MDHKVARRRDPHRNQRGRAKALTSPASPEVAVELVLAIGYYIKALTKQSTDDVLSPKVIYASYLRIDYQRAWYLVPLSGNHPHSVQLTAGQDNGILAPQGAGREGSRPGEM